MRDETYAGTIWLLKLSASEHAIYEHAGLVIEAPPSQRWMKGKRLSEVREWVRKQRGSIVPVCPNTAPVCDGCGAIHGGFLRTTAGDFCTACAQMFRKSSGQPRPGTRPGVSAPSRPARRASSPVSSRQTFLQRHGSSGGTASKAASSHGHEPDDLKIVFE